MTPILACRPDGVPPAAHGLCYVPMHDRYEWRDCLWRPYSAPASWFYVEQHRRAAPGAHRLAVCSAAAILAELEDRVREWWRPAA